MDKSEQELLAEISMKLDRLIGLSATQGRSVAQQLAILKGMGYDWGSIGLVVGMTANAARKCHTRHSKDS